MKNMRNKTERQLPEHREKNLEVMRCPERKEADKRRLGTEEEKRKTRLRKAGPDALASHRDWHARRMASSKKRARAHIERVYANRLRDTVAQGGTWKQAAQQLAEAEGKAVNDYPSIMPPSFMGLHDAQSLRHISEMYSFLHEAKWCTCVGCWRAWYHVSEDFCFSAVETKAGFEKPWYQPSQSTSFRTRAVLKHIALFDGSALCFFICLDSRHHAQVSQLLCGPSSVVHVSDI